MANSANNDKTMAIVSYFIFFIPLLTGNKSKFVMHHANQSLVLLIAWIIANVVMGFVPVLGAIVGMLASLGLLVLWIMGLIQASKGETNPLPLIGGIKILS